VQLDPEMPRSEVRRQLRMVRDRLLYHQRRNAVARNSHAKTRRQRLEEVGIDLAAARRCPRTL